MVGGKGIFIQNLRLIFRTAAHSNLRSVLCCCQKVIQCRLCSSVEVRKVAPVNAGGARVHFSLGRLRRGSWHVYWGDISPGFHSHRSFNKANGPNARGSKNLLLRSFKRSESKKLTRKMRVAVVVKAPPASTTTSWYSSKQNLFWVWILYWDAMHFRVLVSREALEATTAAA